jgi:hypothetical protein
MLLKFWSDLVVITLMDMSINVYSTMPKRGIYNYKNPVICVIYD